MESSTSFGQWPKSVFCDYVLALVSCNYQVLNDLSLFLWWKKVYKFIYLLLVNAIHISKSFWDLLSKHINMTYKIYNDLQINGYQTWFF